MLSVAVAQQLHPPPTLFLLSTNGTLQGRQRCTFQLENNYSDDQLKCHTQISNRRDAIAIYFNEPEYVYVRKLTIILQALKQSSKQPHNDINDPTRSPFPICRVCVIVLDGVKNIT